MLIRLVDMIFHPVILKSGLTRSLVLRRIFVDLVEPEKKEKNVLKLKTISPKTNKRPN